MSVSNHALGPSLRSARRGFGFALLLSLLVFFSATGSAVDYARAALADGFDFPVGKPDADGYYKARGYSPQGHHGEDWNGNGGGNTDLGDPVYACGDGVVVQSRDVQVGWGNVIIIRHAYRDTDGKINFIDSLYGHLNTRYVTLHQRVKRGQRIGTIGTNRGMYLAHLHFEIRKNIYIGMHRSKFARGYGNYWDPTYFIKTHRRCQQSAGSYQVPINTFMPYPAGKRDTVVSKPMRDAPIAKVETRKPISIPVETTKRTAVRSTAPSPNPPSNATRYMDSGSQRRTLSPTTQRIVAAERERSSPAPAAKAERKSFFSKLKERIKSRESADSSRAKPIGRRRGLFGRK